MKMLKGVIFATAFLSASLNATEVLATINDKTINKSDIDLILKKSNITFDELSLEDKEQVLNRLIDRELLVDVAKSVGIEKDEEFKKALENYRKDLLIEVWMDKLYKRTLVSDSEANKYYQEHIDSFKTPAQAHARHILVKSEDEAKKIIDELSRIKS